MLSTWYTEQRETSDTDKEGGGLSTHTQVRNFCCVHMPVKKKPLGLDICCLSISLMLWKLRVLINGFQQRLAKKRDDWKLCDFASLPHLEHELEDMHVCSQSCWDKYSDRHRCRALIFLFAQAESCSTQISRQWTFVLLWPSLIRSTLRPSQRQWKVAT